MGTTSIRELNGGLVLHIKAEVGASGDGDGDSVGFGVGDGTLAMVLVRRL